MSVNLYRPFAQLNIAASDYDQMAEFGADVTESQVVVKIPTSLNLVDGSVSGDKSIVYSYADIPQGEEFPVAGHKYLSMNYLLAGAEKKQIDAAERYAYCIGLAFQIRDDMLDVMGDQAALGKRIGADAQHDKCKFAYFYGLERCQEMVDSLTEEAVQVVKEAFSGSEFLQDLAVWLAKRDH